MTSLLGRAGLGCGVGEHRGWSVYGTAEEHGEGMLLKNDIYGIWFGGLKRGEPSLSAQLVSTAGVWRNDPLVEGASGASANCEYAQVPQLEIGRHVTRVAQDIISVGIGLKDATRQMGPGGDDIVNEFAETVGVNSTGSAANMSARTG